MGALNFGSLLEPPVIDLPQMSADLSILQAALIGYQYKGDQIDAKMAEIRLGLGGKTAGGKRSGRTAIGAPGTPVKRVKRVVSPAGRRRMAAAPRKRGDRKRTRLNSSH